MSFVFVFLFVKWVEFILLILLEAFVISFVIQFVLHNSQYIIEQWRVIKLKLLSEYDPSIEEVS